MAARGHGRLRRRFCSRPRLRSLAGEGWGGGFARSPVRGRRRPYFAAALILSRVNRYWVSACGLWHSKQVLRLALSLGFLSGVNT